jgi:hypothetical protein
MQIQGRVHHGVVVLDGNFTLPEGMAVTVSCPPSATTDGVSKRRIELPLVRSDEPGSLLLTAERVAELLDDDDLSG